MDINVGLKDNPILGYKTPDYIQRILPERLARRLGIVPLAIIKGELFIGAYKALPLENRNTLEKSIRYPIRVFLISYTQVIRLQSRLYQQTDPQPPSLPLSELLNVLGMEYIQTALSSQVNEGQPLCHDFCEWQQRGLITDSQWAQLVSMCHYLPNKIDIQPSSINTLPEFLDIDPALKRKVQSFVPLWWVNRTLYIGISNLDQADQVAGITDKWPCQTATITIPDRLLKKIKKDHSGKNLFAAEIHDEQIAEALLSIQAITEEEYQAGLTLSRRTEKTLCQALSESRPAIARQWLETKAQFAGTLAIHAEELPANFEHVLDSLFNIIPYEICQMLSVLPLNFMDGILIVGLAELHPGILNILSDICGYPAEARLMTEETISDQLANVKLSEANLPDFKIGIPQIEAFLVTSHLIQPEQLQRLDLSRNLPIHSYLSRLTAEGLLSEEDVAQIYAILFQIPHLTLDNIRIDEDLAQRFSQSFLRDNQFLPLLEREGALWVAVANPLQGESLEKLAEISGLSVWPFVVPKTSLEHAIRQVINFAPTDKSSPYLEKCLHYLVGQGMLREEVIGQILHDILEKEQLFDRVIRSYQINPSQDLYQQFAAFRSVDYVSLQPQIEVQKMIDPLGHQIEQTRRRDPVEMSIARQIDYETAKRLSALPISEDETGLRIAFASPLYDAALNELSARFEIPLEPVIAQRDDLDQAIERILGRKNIGTLLAASGLVTRNQLNDALNLAENTNTHIGQALIHRGYITENQLYTFLSKQIGIPLFDLSQVTLSKEAAEIFTPDEEWEWGVLPLARDDQHLVVGMIDPVNQDSLAFVHERTDLTVTPVLITEHDFENALENLFKEQYTTRSVSALLSRAPENSAAQVLTKQQKIWMIVFLIAMAGLAIWNFKNFLIGLNAAFTMIYMMMVIYKFFLISKAIGSDLEVPISDEELEALRDDELPTYSILIPVYKEAAVLPSLLKAVANLDYPKIKLDVKVLLEQDDEETIAAFYNSNPPEFIHALIVPTSLPKTKPKACNYGIIHAKGELLVIFDAEDQPDPDQLKKIVIAFNKSPANVICMQAKLNYFNRQQNLLTQWFSSEYSMWFDLFLPGLDASNVPIPLGGTSNHFKKFALIEAGAWDPYNMTEDADLGIRLYKLGYRTKIVDTTTYEEANSDVKNWVRQRSRWVKGHIQTWLVHMRHPLKLIRDIGFKAFFSFQMVVGGNIFTVILNPVYWLITISWLLFHFDFISALFPGPIHYLGAFSLYFGNFAFTYMNVAGAMGRGYYDMVKTTLLSPLYWGLMSIGGWRGFIQVITKPHYWEKTIHGLSSAEGEGEETADESGDLPMEEGAA